MNRLQKKCLIAAAGTHLLVVVAVLCSGVHHVETEAGRFAGARRDSGELD